MPASSYDYRIDFRLQNLLRKLSEGASEAGLLDASPRLTREDLQAAMQYAADTVAHGEVVLTGSGSSSLRD